MKILELRLKNLNSLYGEWIIDFTNLEYTSNGIFVLTGPTGAGKSTILDAICLALYGSTPRLGKITKSKNDIMSRQTSECYAEVVFESQVGRFRCRWEQRRARKSIEGNLQDPQHEIADADTGNLIETQKSLVSHAIEKRTGMDFDRFTHSILLVQGKFDIFLKAADEQKSKILEQITGTEIYSKISLSVHKRQRDEHEKLENLRNKISGIIILDEKKEKKVNENLENKKKEKEYLESQLEKINENITWRTTIDNLTKELRGLTDQEATLKTNIENFKPKQTKLEQADKAASLDGPYEKFKTLSDQQEKNRKSLKNEESTLPKLETSANTQTEALKTAEELTRKAKKKREEDAPLIQEVRLLDQKISGQTNTISENDKACTKEAEEIETHKQDREKEQEKRTKKNQLLSGVKLYLEENLQDEWLITNLAGIEEQFKNLLVKQEEISQKETDIQKTNAAVEDSIKELKKISELCSLKKQELESVNKNLQQSKDALSELLGDKLLREYCAEKETLLREMAYIKKIEKLEDLRTKLEDGKPCPLCGSTKHPFTKGNVPIPDKIEEKIESLTNLIDEAGKQETAIKELERKKATAQENQNNSEKLEAEAVNGKNAAENTLAEEKKTLTNLWTDFEKLMLAVSQKLKPLGITEIPESEVETFLESLKSRLTEWQKQVRQKTDIEKEIAKIDGNLKGLNAEIDTKNKHLTEKKQDMERLKKELSDEEKKRKELYGEKDPSHEEKCLEKSISEAEKAEKVARNEEKKLREKLTTAQANVKSLEQNIEQRTPDLEKAETDFSTALSQKGFADKKSFLDARLPDEERKNLSSQAKKLDDEEKELEAKKKDRKRRLDKKINEKLTDKTREELKVQLQKIQEDIKQSLDEITELRYKLRENEKNKEQNKKSQLDIEFQEKEWCRWDKLNRLIGSADGKKYRNFAQGLTFESMVFHANRQLEKMTDRYLLIRDKQQPLELNVVDNYQAGEIRSTKNLSGGESFIVSLTLALGLSRMASQNVRVDSLFLDEGFGTLDEEALETALETLSGLQHDGKLIGIISHVAALKERISTQINIKPISGGRSSLSGPGCKKGKDVQK